MRKLCFVLMAACLFALAARAEDTNALTTQIGRLEAETGGILIKGFGKVGSMNTSGGVISIRCKETSSLATGQKLYGLAIELATNTDREFLLVDYDELDPLISGMDYLGKITYDVTALPGFDASISTKSGLRFVAYSTQRQGGIQNFVQFRDQPRILLASDELGKFQSLLSQAKNSLDALKNPR